MATKKIVHSNDVACGLKVADGEQIARLGRRVSVTCGGCLDALQKREREKIERDVHDRTLHPTLVEGCATCADNAGRKLSAVRFEADYQIRNAESAKEKLKTDIDRDFASALEWSREAFEVAAREKVANVVLQILNQEKFQRPGPDPDGEPAYYEPSAVERLAYLTKHVEYEAMRGARWPSFSTSPTSNLTGIYQTSAWASVLASLKGIL